ncbi:prepilin-type N-terminal cleavage/methylation domain-containing protein [Pseudomonas kermanshahensis]|uniref:prepilin-type N-terminal cleavage/methylation domain-containing protein n=1 Tax=Pseudomonas kermanshahensis TaxID=2745482 RepID=UPI0023DA9B73|nr:prepilin-type N-terminal cleavage/methylation domain-containing protein [Pseudomonas kermanshahensis]WEL56184.1 prepilin-type N-terminal cleavage/methylation domain-containing protein [Pseudomonas kermanshahensis]
MRTIEGGMTLLEVLLAMVVVAVGLFAAAALQVRALQATDSARHDAQAALLKHTQLERSRAADARKVQR